jgi:hypothetical protein
MPLLLVLDVMWCSGKFSTLALELAEGSSALKPLPLLPSLLLLLLLWGRWGLREKLSLPLLRRSWPVKPQSAGAADSAFDSACLVATTEPAAAASMLLSLASAAALSSSPASDADAQTSS